MFVWWCLCGAVGCFVVVFVWWCFCGGVFVVFFFVVVIFVVVFL